MAVQQQGLAASMEEEVEAISPQPVTGEEAGPCPTTASLPQVGLEDMPPLLHDGKGEQLAAGPPVQVAAAGEAAAATEAAAAAAAVAAAPGEGPKKPFPPCLRCKEHKPPTCYYSWGTPKWRNFYVCKPCAKRRTVEHRRADPAARIHNRISKSCRQKNVSLKLSRKEIRDLLSTVTDPSLIDEDRLTLRALRAGEAVTVGNVELVLRDDIGRKAGKKLKMQHFTTGVVTGAIN